MRRSGPLALLLAVAALGLAACGDDDDDRGDLNVQTGTGTAGETSTTKTTPMPLGEASETVRVRETEYELDPADPRIAKTGVVAFRVVNAGNITHALEVEGPGGEQETKAIEPGGSATLKVLFNRAGRYEWYCPIGDHKDRGMRGEITVGGGGAGRSDDSGGEGETNTSGGEVEGESGDDSGGGGGNSGPDGGGSGY